MSIGIEKNVPLPTFGQRKIYPLKEMEVGDSFLEDDLTKDNNLRNAASRCGRTYKRKYTVRRDGDGLRCWRTE